MAASAQTEKIGHCDADTSGHPSSQSQHWITLNVGGRRFTTTRSTLVQKEPKCMLALMFADGDGDADDPTQQRPRPSDRDATGAYLIDRSARYFEPILDYLRHGQLIRDDGCSLHGILEEARFYGIDSLLEPLRQAIAAGDAAACAANGLAPLTRRDVVQAILQTPRDSELRFQGVDLSGADLSKLDLQNINFKFARLSGANLSMANLNNCCLERADLSHANMEGAQLLSVRGSSANMEGANLQGCNFEDPHGVRTCLEGVNLKGACLENSNMACVNLRVANLKDANMKNCNLRSAVLAGADLERCTLSGSDLHEANLRGANFKDVELERMQTPLHMSQAIR